MTYRDLLSIIIAIFISITLVSCKKETVPTDNPPPTQSETFRILDVSIPVILNVQRDADVHIVGKGYQNNDIIVLNALDNPSRSHTLTLTSIQTDHVIIRLPTDFVDGRYSIVAKRGEETQTLGNTNFNTVLRTDIPDQQDKNIKGVIHVNGVGLENVVVSDGMDVTTTDDNGVYYLTSTKRTGYVFVSIPGNYEVTSSEGNFPQFYKYLHANPNLTEIIDFELTPANNENHIVLGLADLHLANRNNDITQFRNGFITDVNTLISGYKAQGKKVYGLTLGDLTWETYWYSNNFALPEYIQEINKVEAPVFNVIGNHDHDPYFANDWMAENTYRRTIGPTYYSFNLGKVHYIVLDNTEYLNTGGAAGVVGDRNYNATISTQQMDWLAKDLATVDASTPIVLGMHIQLHNAPNVDANMPNFRISNGSQLVSLFSRFDDVHVLTGHTHVNYRVPRDSRFMEHNIAAICATWWWTGRDGYANNQIAPDGSPGGYTVWDINGTDIAWLYKAIGYENDYQFRSYDLNNVHITADQYLPNANAQHRALLDDYAFDFSSANNNNEVLINVWGYDPQWTVTVTENGQPLMVQRIASRDPLHIISYGMKRLNVNAVPTFGASNTSHMFKVQASAPNTTLQISVEDRFGTTYTETMQRPKAFTYSMR